MLNSALGMGVTLVGKDQASPAIGTVRKSLHGLMGDLGKSRDATGRFMTGAQRNFAQVGQGAESARTGVARLGEGLHKMQGHLAAGGVTAMAQGLVGLGTAWSLAQESGTFEAAMSRLKAVSGGTTEELERMRAASVNAGLTMGVAPEMAADALASLSTAGFKANDALKMLKPTLDLTAAAAGKINAAQGAELLAQSLNVFGMQAKDATKVGDLIGRGGDMFAFGVEDAQLGIANMARGVTALKANASESMIAFGLVKGAGLSTQSAGTAVAVAMERLASPETQKALKGIGVEAVDSAGKFRPFLSVLQELEGATSGMTDAKKANFLQDAFGAEGMASVGAILTQFSNGVAAVDGKKGPAALDALRSAMNNSEGALAKFAVTATDNMPGAMMKAEAAWKTLKQSLGEPFGELAKEAFTDLTTGVRNATLWFRGLSPEVKKTIAVVGLVASALIAAAGGAAVLVAGISIAGPAIATVAQGFVPIVAAAALAGGAIYAFKYAIERNLGGIGDRFKQLGVLVDGWKDRITSLADRAGPMLDGFGRGFGQGLAEAEPTFRRLSTAVGGFLDVLGLGGPKVDASAESVDGWGRTGVRVGNMAADAFDGLARALSAGLEFAAGYTKNFDVMAQVVDPLKASVVELGAAFGTLNGSLADGSPENATTGWRTLGSAIGFVSSLVGGAVTGAILMAAGAFNGLANVSSGMVDVMAGILSGKWAMAWDGAGKVVFGVLKVVTSVIGGTISQVAGLIDALGKLGGQDLGLKTRFAGFQRDLERSMEGTLVGGGVGAAAVRVGRAAEGALVQQRADDEMRATPRSARATLAEARLADSYSTNRATLAQLRLSDGTSPVRYEGPKPQALAAAAAAPASKPAAADPAMLAAIKGIKPVIQARFFIDSADIPVRTEDLGSAPIE